MGNSGFFFSEQRLSRKSEIYQRENTGTRIKNAKEEVYNIKNEKRERRWK